MNTRFKDVRKAKGLTQQKMAEDLHLSNRMIQSYEYGKSELTDRTIADISRLYNVNEDWLRTGQGEMFMPADLESEIADIVSALGNAENPFCVKLMHTLALLPEETWDKVAEVVSLLASEMEKEKSAPNE